MVMPYHLHMPSYFLETFTEYPFISLSCIFKSCSRKNGDRDSLCRHYVGTFIKYYKISQLIHTQSIAN